MVVTTDDVSECRQALFDSLDLDAIGYGIAEMLKFLVGSGCGNKETFPIAARSPVSAGFTLLITSINVNACLPSRQPPYYSRPSNGGVTYWNDVLELSFENTISIQ